MPTVYLSDGLGNQLFQLAGYIAMCSRNSIDPVISPRFYVWKNDHYEAEPLWGGHPFACVPSLQEVFPKLTISQNVEMVGGPLSTCDLKMLCAYASDGQRDYQLQENDMIKNYFFCYRWYHGEKEKILDLLRPTSEQVEAAHQLMRIDPNQRKVSVHLRLPSPVDFLHQRLDIDWIRARMIMLDDGSNHFVVFSPNSDKAKEALGDVVTNVTYIDADPHLSYHAMTLCHEHILTASTFGFWGAYASFAQGKVHVPDFFFVTAHSGSMIPPEDRWDASMMKRLESASLIRLFLMDFKVPHDAEDVQFMLDNVESMDFASLMHMTRYDFRFFNEVARRAESTRCAVIAQYIHAMMARCPPHVAEIMAPARDMFGSLWKR